MSAHDDYLDPDLHLWPAEDYGFENIQSALRKRSTGRWRWDAIDCCWTGKDADLEPFGNQGCILIAVDEEFATVEVHAGKTFVGLDVSLNLPKHADRSEKLSDAARDIYMKQAQGVVCGCGTSGEWDGDSWYMNYKGVIKVPIIPNEGKTDVDDEKMAEAILTAAKASLAGWEREIGLADDMLNVLAGWDRYSSKKELVPCKEGRPGPGSVWAMLRSANQ